MKKLNEQRGYTLIEVIIAAALLAIIIIPLTLFTKTAVEHLTKSKKNAEAQEAVRMALMKIEPILLEANEIYYDPNFKTGKSAINFICDSCVMPAYAPKGDFDADGIRNIDDPDDDEDAMIAVLEPPATKWKYGYDIYDDDDNNNGLIDVRYHIYVDNNKNLILAVSYDENPWKNEIIARDVTKLEFSYYGSKSEPGGTALDVGDDGVAGTGDPGELDGLITETEILQSGNKNAYFDTLKELNAIVSINITIGIGGTTAEPVSEFDSEVSPPLLLLKRRIF